MKSAWFKTPLWLQIALVFACTALTMFAFESAKEAAPVQLSTWESHNLTIVVTALLASAASVFLRTLALSQEAEQLARLNAREHSFHSLADNIPLNVHRCDTQGRALFINKALEQTLRRPAAALLGKTHDEAIPGPYARALDDAVRRVGATGVSEEIEHCVPGPQGCIAHHSLRIVAETGAQGKPASVLVVGRDITEQKRMEEELRLAASMFHNSSEGVLITNADATILSVNPAFTEITGYGEDEAVGAKPSLLRSDRHDAAFYQSMWQALLLAGRWQGEIWNRRKGGEAYLEWLTINRIVDDNGTTVRYVSVFHDITESRSKDERIRHLAFHDALTGLPNRALFQERLEHAIERMRREGTRLSVTFIDLDGFKDVNDTLGHDVGDRLLQEVAKRIRARVRRGVDTVARLGGDEFVVLMENLKEAEHCACLASEIIDDIAQPIDLQGHDIRVGASMGMAFFPEDGASAQELMKRADTAMYAAKQAGKGTYRFFRDEMLEAVSSRLTLEEELRHAIRAGQLELHYQPKIRLADGAVRGVEALVRWRHPVRGIVMPGDFIPLAEDTGLILPLGDWVLETACRQAAAWHAAGLDTAIAVNISAQQIIKGKVHERIEQLLTQHALPPRALQIELTESTLMTDAPRAIASLHRLRELGIVVAVDDFGTGYSSLSRLRSLPIDLLKIDRSFVMNADRDEKDAQVVRLVVGLATTLGLDIVAEGVESAAQASLLEDAGCAVCQGHYYAEARPAALLEPLLRDTWGLDPVPAA